MRIWLAVLTGALLLTVACGSNNNAAKNTTTTNTGMSRNTGSMPTAAGPLATGAAASPVANATTVTVTLSEYAVTLDRTSVPAGPVHFIVTNSGQRGHQFQVYAAGMVTQTGGGHAMQAMANGAMLGAVGFLQVISTGQTQVLDVTLPAGSWELACHIQDSANGASFDHYDKGMKTTLMVG